MSTLKATYTTNSTLQIIEVPFDSTKPLTDSIINLQDKVNTLLTQVLEEEKQAKKITQVVKTVQQDEAEDELKEMAEAEAEAEVEAEDNDSP
ncbi:hypothetical protein ABG067_008901, partial [Albugo candida]